MITTISAIEFLAVMALTEIGTNGKANEEKSLKWTYPELREKADLIEEEFPSIRIDLRRASLENFPFIDVDKNISIQMNDKTKELMEYYRPSDHLYKQFREVITQ